MKVFNMPRLPIRGHFSHCQQKCTKKRISCTQHTPTTSTAIYATWFVCESAGEHCPLTSKFLDSITCSSSKAYREVTKLWHGKLVNNCFFFLGEESTCLIKGAKWFYFFYLWFIFMWLFRLVQWVDWCFFFFLLIFF